MLSLQCFEKSQSHSVKMLIKLIFPNDALMIFSLLPSSHTDETYIKYNACMEFIKYYCYYYYSAGRMQGKLMKKLANSFTAFQSSAPFPLTGVIKAKFE
ncbi:hypothetical protein T12_10210 [Trichinella patagoniensis]|uniref:Uncharacterized protein n=1 Tax=Trichinella patagoniensis TaxID=990121 RepID=A0A0V0ZW83_9BILA|nr:hypothetical protein T12_10210 [Trichinella patagoniensis]